jgi:phage tail sheath protein FI
MMATTYSVPGVYYEPRPRVLPRALARTDVVGFVGFEPRIRDGTTPCQLVVGPPSGYKFQVDLIGFQLPLGLLGAGRPTVPAVSDFPLSQGTGAPPMAPGGSIKYALAAVLGGGKVQLLAVAGPASATEDAADATDQDIETAAAGNPWLRLADVHIRLSDDGSQVFPTILPALPPARCDDWNDFQLQLGGIPAVDDGTLLARSVRMYFANGGSRCHVATIRRPRFDDATGLDAAIADLVGTAGASESEATGLERLLRIFEVAIVDAPDLYARRVDPDVQTFQLPPQDVAACFRKCNEIIAVRVGVDAVGSHAAGGPLFDDSAVLAAQQAMLLRCAPDRWRVLLLLAAPVGFDPSTGVFRGRDADGAVQWRQQFSNTVDDLSASVGAFYHPWALTQETVGAPIVELPPTPLAAGILARRDVARGPHVAPANERLVGVVGLSPSVDDATNAVIYETPLNINPLRAFAGLGIQVWGARTLSSDPWMRYLPVRRCLSAIERRAYTALRYLVFEPNTPTLWFQITQAILGILVPIFDAGALRGDTRDQAFYVRCDGSNNPPDTVAVGQVLCEVGVAIAAPAEFIVFRVGRREGVVEVLE